MDADSYSIFQFCVRSKICPVFLVYAITRSIFIRFLWNFIGKLLLEPIIFNPLFQKGPHKYLCNCFNIFYLFNNFIGPYPKPRKQASAVNLKIFTLVRSKNYGLVFVQLNFSLFKEYSFIFPMGELEYPTFLCIFLFLNGLSKQVACSSSFWSAILD